MFGLSKADKIKKTHSIEQVVTNYGGFFKKVGNSIQCRCPFPDHEDKTPSFSILKEKGIFNCFGCGRKGDVISFVAQMEGISNSEAMNKLDSDYKPITLTNPIKAPEVINNKKSDNDIFRAISEIYHQTFLRENKAHVYLESRGLNDKGIWKHYRIGYCNGNAIQNAINEDEKEQLKRLGILNDKGNESLYKCIVIPLLDQDGQVVGFYGRSIEGKRHYYTKGDQKGLFNARSCQSTKDLILTESIFDALSLIQLGFNQVLPMYGVNGETPIITKAIKEINPEELILFFDNDDAGEKTANKMQRSYDKKKVKVSIAKLPEGIKDINEFLSNGAEPNDIKGLLKNRSLINEGKSTISPVNDGLVYQDEDQILFKYDDLHYRVKGDSKEKGSLKIILNTYKEDSKHIDRIDLYSDRQRRNFSKNVEEKCKTQSSKVESHLLNILFELEQQDKPIKKDQPEYKISPREEAEALKLLKEKKLMNKILKDITSLGYVGQDREKLLLYLSATARITEHPIHVSIQAASSSGKSAMMESVISLFPPENVEHFSRISGQSLYYMESLKNKILIVDERCGAEEAEFALRSLMSRNRLDLAVVQKDDKGQCKTKIIEIAGPTTVWDSTTHTATEDNRNRAFECFMDESKEQTERVQSQERDAFSPEYWDNEDQVSCVRSLHQNAQRLLKPLNVSIPYKDLIKFPSMSTRSRRDFKRFLYLIAVISLLHQFQRERKKTVKGNEYIEATIEDYTWAHKIIHDILENSYSLIGRESRKLVEILHRCVKNSAEKEGVNSAHYRFSRRDIRLWTRWSETKVRQSITELLRMEILQCESGGRGRGGFRYKLMCSEDFKTDINLMHPDELRRKLKLAENKEN